MRFNPDLEVGILLHHVYYFIEDENADAEKQIPQTLKYLQTLK